MNGAFSVPTDSNKPLAGVRVIAHSSFQQTKHSESSLMDSVHLYRYYIERLALQNKALLLQGSPFISQTPQYFGNGILQIGNELQTNQLLLSNNRGLM